MVLTAGCQGETVIGDRSGEILVAAGDIVECADDRDEATAALIARADPDVIATLGDNVYETGTTKEFDRCFDPSWGGHRRKMRPVPGNHEYLGDGEGAGYYEYFGKVAAPPGGYYAYDVGSWRAIALNSQLCEYGDCGPDSAQLRWLRRELDGSATRCTIAYWHHAYASSGGEHGPEPAVRPLWRLLVDAGVEVALVAHDHHYERFAPMTARGGADPAGLRQFVVGTGGSELYPLAKAVPNSEARSDDVHGVLALELQRGRYEWEFLAAPPDEFEDTGSDRCHGPPNRRRIAR